MELDPKSRILGLDIGTKRTGVAISDTTRLISSPFTLIETRSKLEWITRVLEIIEEEQIAEVLVGLPLNQNGEEGQDAENIRKFIALLREKVQIPVIEWDERFTTVQAERTLLEADLSRKRRKLVVDKVAAAITLQSYLDRLRFDIN